MRAAAHTAAERGNMLEAYLKIDIAPVAKARPRFKMIHGHAMAYTTAKTKDFEQQIAEHYALRANGVYFDRELPLKVSIVFGLPVPKATTKSRRLAMLTGRLKPVKRPDIDNYAKAVLDALNGVAWADDAQIVELALYKKYAEEPYTQIYIRESVTE